MGVDALVGVAVEAKVIERIRVRGERGVMRSRGERPTKVVRERCAKVDRLPGYRMPKAQPRRVQKVPPRW